MIMMWMGFWVHRPLDTGDSSQSTMHRQSCIQSSSHSACAFRKRLHDCPKFAWRGLEIESNVAHPGDSEQHTCKLFKKGAFGLHNLTQIKEEDENRIVTEDKCLLTCSVARLSRSQCEESVLGVSVCMCVCEYLTDWSCRKCSSSLENREVLCSFIFWRLFLTTCCYRNTRIYFRSVWSRFFTYIKIT